MNEVTKSSKNITPFGGLNFIYDALSRAGIDNYIDQKIGYRSANAVYSYSDVVFSFLGNILSQGSFISDLQVLKKKYSNQLFTKIPSPDTIEYVCQELKQPSEFREGGPGVVHEVNYNNQFNSALIGLAVKTKQLNVNEQGYILDFDNMVLPNEKQDSKQCYNMLKGYHPNIAFIGRIPVHIENHNGNTPARYEQKQTLERCFDNLDKQNIKIEHFRADAASYQKEVIEAVEKRAKYFYIRNMDSADFRQACSSIKVWKTVRINYEKKEVASLYYQPGMMSKSYRIVVTRNPRKDKQLDLLTNCAYNYQGIITNNEQMSEQTVIEFYNSRGDAENSNRFLLNDFNFNHLPFPDMDTNTVYMYLMAMCATLFEWTKLILIQNEVEEITLAMRTKAVCFHYITVAATFINHARKTILKVFSTNDYAILRI